MRKQFREGDLVRYSGPVGLGPAFGAEGTVAKVAGVRGKSIHPDPSHSMTFVQWEDGHGEGVYTQHLELLMGRFDREVIRAAVRRRIARVAP